VAGGCADGARRTRSQRRRLRGRLDPNHHHHEPDSHRQLGGTRLDGRCPRRPRREVRDGDGHPRIGRRPGL